MGIAGFQWWSTLQPPPTEAIIIEPNPAAPTKNDISGLSCAQRSLNSPRPNSRYCIKTFGELGMVMDPCFIMNDGKRVICPQANKDGEITEEAYQDAAFPVFAVDKGQKGTTLPDDLLEKQAPPWGLYIDTEGPLGKVACMLTQPAATYPFDAAKGNYECPSFAPMVFVDDVISGRSTTAFLFNGDGFTRAIDIDRTSQQWTIKLFDKEKNQYVTVPVLKAWY
jgi:hypothetical protein